MTYATLDPANTGTSVTLSGGNLTATKSSGSAWRTSNATITKATGKWYFEAAFNSNVSSNEMMGVATVDVTANYLGYLDTTMCSLQGRSSATQLATFTNGARTDRGTPTLVSGAVGKCAVDCDTGYVWFGRASEGTWIGGGDPAAGTSPTFSLTAGGTFRFGVSVFSTTTNITANFGASAFTGTVPSGFNAGLYS